LHVALPLWPKKHAGYEQNVNLYNFLLLIRCMMGAYRTTTKTPHSHPHNDGDRDVDRDVFSLLAVEGSFFYNLKQFFVVFFEKATTCPMSIVLSLCRSVATSVVVRAEEAFVVAAATAAAFEFNVKYTHQ